MLEIILKAIDKDMEFFIILIKVFLMKVILKMVYLMEKAKQKINKVL
jgi:hypothetical protein